MRFILRRMQRSLDRANVSPLWSQRTVPHIAVSERHRSFVIDFPNVASAFNKIKSIAINFQKTPEFTTSYSAIRYHLQNNKDPYRTSQDAYAERGNSILDHHTLNCWY